MIDQFENPVHINIKFNIASSQLKRREYPMEVIKHGATIALAVGDITKENTDAIVNAANSGLRGGGGVDGAIHRAGGPAIMAECRQIGYCPTGQAVITTGGNLKARYVIHTVGPVYRGGTKGEAGLLRSAYRNSLILAAERGLKSVAFPAISAGIYGYPLADAARIGLTTTIEFLAEGHRLELVRFVLYTQAVYDAFDAELRKVG